MISKNLSPYSQESLVVVVVTNNVNNEDQQKINKNNYTYRGDGQP
jgi:hypothetical protein